MPLSEFLAPIANQFRDWSLSDLRPVETLNYEVFANWKLIFQNYNECYHCPVVHPVLNQLTPFRNADNVVESGPILGGPMKLAGDCETMSTDGKYVGSCLPNLTKAQQMSVNYFTVFPTMFLSTHPDYVLVHQLERIDVGSTRIRCDLLMHPDAIERGADPTRAVEFWDMTNKQDWEVCELAQTGMEDPGYIPGPYSNLESVLAAFDKHYQSQL